MSKNLVIAIVVAVIILSGAIYFAYSGKMMPTQMMSMSKSAKMDMATKDRTANKFALLSANGNSSCSVVFRNSIDTMPNGMRLQGSCCSPMSLHRYTEQVDGLKKYKDIAEIPKDPYDIEAGQAKKLMSYYDMRLTPDEQKAYDYAMENSEEKGPCCCKCWRWNVYGGLGKYLIRNYHFTGAQVTDVWNLSDGCGGDNDHHHA